MGNYESRRVFFVLFAVKDRLFAMLNIIYIRNKAVAKSAATSIIQPASLCKVPAGGVRLVQQRQVVPVARDTKLTLWVFKCCCLHMASEPSRKTGEKKRVEK